MTEAMQKCGQALVPVLRVLHSLAYDGDTNEFRDLIKSVSHDGVVRVREEHHVEYVHNRQPHLWIDLGVDGINHTRQ